jgi:hypothetical protein
LELSREITASRQARAEAYLKATAARLEESGTQVETSVRQGSTLENIIHFVSENGIRGYSEVHHIHIIDACPYPNDHTLEGGPIRCTALT